MQNIEKSTYCHYPLNRSNIVHVGTVCDWLDKGLRTLPRATPWRSLYSAAGKPGSNQPLHRLKPDASELWGPGNWAVPHSGIFPTLVLHSIYQDPVGFLRELATYLLRTSCHWYIAKSNKAPKTTFFVLLSIWLLSLLSLIKGQLKYFTNFRTPILKILITFKMTYFKLAFAL